MPAEGLLERFRRAIAEYDAAIEALVPALVELALDAVGEVLPGANGLATWGEVGLDGSITVRIVRVLDPTGVVLFDVDDCDEETEHVAQVLADVEFEYLARLAELTQGELIGPGLVPSGL